MKIDETVRAAMGTPIALCVTCAADFAQAYTLRRQGREYTIVCEGCRKRRFGAKYILKQKGESDVKRATKYEET